MECCFEVLCNAVKDGAFTDSGHYADLLYELTEYYEGGQWLADYESDERGELPSDLKRGVLSQDGLYNLLEDIKQIK
ncbi:MAG: DUF4298 domain-containing protein [Oscillospiraceae bacterium]|nr:DUF4298 domain-containing protein [Oscillospiraceae bacterium]